MLKIGITGGIGSGKTTVCKIFEVLGISIFYADVVAKEIMNTDLLLVKDIKRVFGIEAYQDDVLNRKYLAEIVFNDSNQLKKLNLLVHPAVFRAFDGWVLNQKSPYIIKEAALLFESGSDKMCHKTMLVKSPKTLKLKRVMHRDNVSEEQVLARMTKQFTDEEKEKLSDYILINDEKQVLTTQVISLHQQFLSLASK